MTFPSICVCFNVFGGRRIIFTRTNRVCKIMKDLNKSLCSLHRSEKSIDQDYLQPFQVFAPEVILTLRSSSISRSSKVSASSRDSSLTIVISASILQHHSRVNIILDGHISSKYRQSSFFQVQMIIIPPSTDNHPSSKNR